jgi:replication factor A1
MANKRYTSVRNDFCIVFEKNSEIVLAEDDGSISNQAFDFCPINDITDIMQMKTIDVVGIISDLGDKEQVNLRSGQTKFRKYIQLVDDTEKCISLTLWGEDMCDK